MLLDRFCQSNIYWKKSEKKLWDIQVWVLWRSFRGRSENALGTSRISLPGTSLEQQIRTFPGCYLRTSPGRQIGRSPRWSNRIFRELWRGSSSGRPGDKYLPAGWFLRKWIIDSKWVIQTINGIKRLMGYLKRLHQQ